MGLFSKLKKVHKSIKKAGDPLKLTNAHKKSKPSTQSSVSGSIKPDVVSVSKLPQRGTGSQPLAGNKPIPMPKPKPGNKPAATAPTTSGGAQRKGLGSVRSRISRK